MAIRQESSSVARSRGFTLIETLVVIVILGVLAGLLLPAIANVRESARRLECVNHLKQIGLAMQAHQGALQTFPPPMPLRKDGQGTLGTSPGMMSGYYDMLPYLEQAPLYHAINLASTGPYWPGPASLENTTASQTRLAGLICPSDSRAARDEEALNSYRFNVNNSQPTGYRSMTTDYQPDRRRGQPGAFVPDLYSRPEDFLDGLSTTAAFAERSVGSRSPMGFDRRRDFWGAGLAGMLTSQDDDGVRDVCGSLVAIPLDFSTEFGARWALGGNPDVWYNHVSTPNAAGADCVLDRARSSMEGYCDLCSVAARSSHPGGANSLMMDGSVRFVRDGLALPIWRALGSRAGGEAIASF